MSRLGLVSVVLIGWLSVVVLSTAQAAEPAEINKAFSERLLTIAKEYGTYGRVDDEGRWAPQLCRMPDPSRVRASTSEDATTHGKKLYFLFAKDRWEYLGRSSKDIVPSDDEKKKTSLPIGQVVVKESWVPEKVERTNDATPEVAIQSKFGKSKEGYGGSILPIVKVGDEKFRAKDKFGLFIMYKLAEDTADTDHGWVYGTVTADGKTVTAAGKVKSCIECHEKAPRDRLFGVKYDGA